MEPRRKLKLLFLLLAPLLAFGQPADDAKRDLDTCHIHEVKTLPGSHYFGSDFIEAMAGDRRTVWALTADLSSKVPENNRAMYISK
jgi:hypothetical protein